MKSTPGRYGIESSLTFGWFHLGYWKTLTNLRADRSLIAIDGATLRFSDYPFAPASVFPNGAIKACDIAEINLSHPAQLRLGSGEILFVPQSSKEALLSFINQNDLQTVQRSSVWSQLLDPFLDTWEDQETIDRQFSWFAALGLDRSTVDAWRREVAIAMTAYNFGTGLWEWTTLDLHDVLIAQRARLGSKAFADFYSRAMRVTELDSVSLSTGFHSDNTIASALSSVLIEWYPRKSSGDLKDFRKEWDLRREQIDHLKNQLANELTLAYSESHRRYHTLAHIEHCLRELANVWYYAIHLNEIRWAVLFHDAIYDPKRHDNEARSADWACRVMDELHRPKDEQARVRAMILATAHLREPSAPDEALLLDIDLSILGADEATFDNYDQAIRFEYEWVPQPNYRQAREKILASFANRARLYQTALFRQRFATTARANLQRALAQLRIS